MAEKKLSVKIGADLTDFSSRLKRAGQMAKRALRGVGLIAIAGTAAALYAGARAYSAAASELDRLAKTARQFQMDPAELQGFQIAAEIGGNSAENLNASLLRLQRRVAMAADGFGAGQKAIEQLKLDAEEMVKLPLGEQFLQVTDAINQLETGSEQAAAAFGLFGREGQNLLEMIRQGRGGMEGFIEEVRRLNPELTEINLAKVEQANDAVLLMVQALKSVRNTFTITLAPAVRRFAEMMRTNVIEPVNEAIRALNLLDLEGVGQGLGETLQKAAEMLRDMVRVLVQAFREGEVLNLFGMSLKLIGGEFVNQLATGLTAVAKSVGSLLLSAGEALVQGLSVGLLRIAEEFGSVLGPKAKAGLKGVAMAQGGTVAGGVASMLSGETSETALKRLEKDLEDVTSSAFADAARVFADTKPQMLVDTEQITRDLSALTTALGENFDRDMQAAAEAAAGVVKDQVKAAPATMGEESEPARPISLRVDDLTRIGALGRRGGVERQIRQAQRQERLLSLQVNLLEAIERNTENGGAATYQ